MPTITISKLAIIIINEEKRKLSEAKGRSVSQSETIENMKVKK